MNGIDFQTGFNLALAALGVLAPFLLKLIFARIDKAQDKAEAVAQALSAHQTYSEKTFLTVDRFEGFEERLFSELRAIKNAIDEKQDK